MANNLIPEELNALIQQYLTDGVLTDKERQVILNKAEKMGLDRDEIDLYLDAEVQKIDQQTDATVRKQKGKTCPYCGGSVPQLTDKCPHCGENITPEASKELQEIFDNLEEALVDFKSGKDIAKSKATVERFMRKAKMYYGNNPKIQKLLEEVEIESVKAEKVAKANARKNTLVSVLTYNKKLTICIVVAVLGLLTWVLWPVNTYSNANACKRAIADALKAGNPDEAAELYRNFDNGEPTTWSLGYGDEIAQGFLNNGEPEKALAFVGKRDPANAFDDDRSIFAEIEKAFLEQNKYDEAISVWDRSGWCAEDNCRVLCECIDRMRKEKSNQELRNFILKYMSLFYDKDKDDFKKRLFDYAGIE